MSIHDVRSGDILDDDADAIVIPVNTVGVMGAGLALQARRKWGEPLRRGYELACTIGMCQVGRCFMWPTLGEPMQLVVCLPTKRHWRNPSRLTDVAAGLRDLHDRIVRFRHDDLRYEINSIAIPALGAGLGGLPWPAVRGEIIDQLGDLDDEIDIRIYGPQ